MRIKQVILNLLSNAVKYNRPGGSIHLDCDHNDNFFVFHVIDNGIGIAENLHDRVFEPFDRLNANTSEIEGTGIGLSLTKKMIELLGGSIDFNSHEGKGSDFWIEIPSASGTTVSTALVKDKEETVTQTTEGNFTLLYVEDNPANLRLVSQLLQTHGNIKLYDAHTASIALDLIESHQFDLILLDIQLPGDGDGFDVLKKIREREDSKNIPVIAISANATEYDVKHGLEAGFDDYITKPIKIDQFMATINLYLSKIVRPTS